MQSLRITGRSWPVRIERDDDGDWHEVVRHIDRRLHQGNEGYDAPHTAWCNEKDLDGAEEFCCGARRPMPRR